MVYIQMAIVVCSCGQTVFSVHTLGVIVCVCIFLYALGCYNIVL